MTGDEVSADVAECCADEENLEEQATGRDDVRLRVCRVCGRRHFEALAEPFTIGVEPS